jgi:hypothetical protein
VNGLLRSRYGVRREETNAQSRGRGEAIRGPDWGKRAVASTTQPCRGGEGAETTGSLPQRAPIENYYRVFAANLALQLLLCCSILCIDRHAFVPSDFSYP